MKEDIIKQERGLMIFKKIYSYYLLYCFLLSVIGYLADCLFGFKYAIQNLNYLPWYFISHTVFQVYVILPAILGYVLIAESRANHMVIKLLYLLIVSFFIASFLYPDDYSLYIGSFKKIKQVTVYILSGLVLFWWAERREILYLKL